jgi:hypothetical protein
MEARFDAVAGISLDDGNYKLRKPFRVDAAGAEPTA